MTLCPLTGTGLVFNATDQDGSQIEFGVSGLLINSNLVMYDRRDGNTLYPQAGPRDRQRAPPTHLGLWPPWAPGPRILFRNHPHPQQR